MRRDQLQHPVFIFWSGCAVVIVIEQLAKNGFTATFFAFLVVVTLPTALFCALVYGPAFIHKLFTRGKTK